MRQRIRHLHPAAAALAARRRRSPLEQPVWAVSKILRKDFPRAFSVSVFWVSWQGGD